VNNEIVDAIYVAAGIGGDSLRIDAPAGPSDRRIARARGIIRRFLENVPEDISAMELRRAVEDIHQQSAD
jgi:hypothetical protein